MVEALSKHFTPVPPMPVIRNFQPADIETITTIYTEAVLTGAGSYEIEPPTVDEMVKRFEAFVEQGFPILVAEEDGRSGLCLCELFPRQACLPLACGGFDLYRPGREGKGYRQAFAAGTHRPYCCIGVPAIAGDHRRWRTQYWFGQAA